MKASLITAVLAVAVCLLSDAPQVSAGVSLRGDSHADAASQVAAFERHLAEQKSMRAMNSKPPATKKPKKVKPTKKPKAKKVKPTKKPKAKKVKPTKKPSAKKVKPTKKPKAKKVKPTKKPSAKKVKPTKKPSGKKDNKKSVGAKSAPSPATTPVATPAAGAASTTDLSKTAKKDEVKPTKNGASTTYAAFSTVSVIALTIVSLF